jgi:aldose 1-epimerase
MSQAATYSVQKLSADGVAIVRLSDSARKMEVSVAPSLGNNAYEMKVNGTPILFSPYKTLGELAVKPAMAGNPFLAPWANRIDQDAFWANGKKFLLNPELGNYRYDANHKPIHGLLVYAKDWKVVAAQADGHAAWVTSRLEFWRHPEWMAQFPFAHAIEMTYRLANGMLEVRTSIENLSGDPMPLVIGFHTYYQIPGVARDTWKVHVAAEQHVELSNILTPTGERKPLSLADPLPLAGTQLDDVFTGLQRDSDQRAEFWVEGEGKKISVLYGRQYLVAVVYAPPGRDFICFEPMTGVTNGYNLAHEGKYAELQSIPPNHTWAESFWIKPSGF